MVAFAGSSSSAGNVGTGALTFRRSDDPVHELPHPGLLTNTLAILAEEFGVRTVAEFAAFEVGRLRSVRGVGRKKLKALRELQLHARFVCSGDAADGEGPSSEPGGTDEPTQKGSDPLVSLEHDSLLTPLLRTLAQSHGIYTIRDLAEFSVRELQWVSGVGIKTMRSLRALQRTAAEVLDAERAASRRAERDVEASPAKTSAGQPWHPGFEVQSTPEEEPNSPLGRLLLAASILGDARVLGDLITLDLAEAMHVANLTHEELATPLSEVVSLAFGGRTLDEVVRIGLEALDVRGREILLRTVLSPLETKETLESIGDSFGFTRERARQLRNGAREEFDRAVGEPLRWLANAYCARLGGVFPVVDLDSMIAARSPSLVISARTTAVARRAALRAAGYRETRGGWCLSAAAQEVADGWKSRLRDAGAATGIVPEVVLESELGGYFRNRALRERYLTEVIGLPVLKGHRLRSDSGRNRCLAALWMLGRPATKSEIGSLVGLSEARVGTYLGQFDQVCRADKIRWAFEEWVDDPYDGIVGEIVQRIEEDGGTTTFERLVTEIPTKFGVSESSVRMFLATPRFVVREGVVREATNQEIRAGDYGDVESSADAVRLPDGDWAARVTVEARFRDGYSASIPAPVARAQGIQPGESLVVPVGDTGHSVSLIWRTTSTTGRVDLGRLAPVLEHLDATDGDSLIVAPSREDVRIWFESEAPILAREPKPKAAPSSQQIDDLLEDIFGR